MSNLPNYCINEPIQGEDHKLLEIFYEAEEAEPSEVSSAILRGIKSVLAHPSQMVEITYEGRVYRIPPGGKVIICNVGDATDFRALCAKVIAYNEGQSPYNFSQLNSHERDNAAYDAWVELKDEIKSALAATANDRLISDKLAVHPQETP